MLQQLHKFHNTAAGYLLFGLVELAMSYGFVSLAIDRGNFWYYLLAFILLMGALKNLLELIGKVFGSGHKPAKARRH